MTTETAAPPAPRAAYLQIGAAFGLMGTVNHALWERRGRLRELGVRDLRDYPQEDFHSSLDLRRVPWALRDLPRVAGAFSRLARRAREWQGVSVLSHGTLAFAEPADIALAAELLDPVELHVAYTTQDLTRQVFLYWNQLVLDRGSWSFPDFVAALQSDADHDDVRAFWDTQDPSRVLERWAGVVPAERIHLITVPTAETPRIHAVERFGRLLGLPEGTLPPEGGPTTLGVLDTEIVRQVNAVLPGSLGPPAYGRMVQDLLANQLMGRRDNDLPAPLDQQQRSWFTSRATRIAEQLRSSGYDVVGDLDELLPAPGAPAAEAVSDVRPDAVMERAIGVAADLLARISDMHDRIGEATRELDELKSSRHA